MAIERIGHSVLLTRSDIEGSLMITPPPGEIRQACKGETGSRVRRTRSRCLGLWDLGLALWVKTLLLPNA